MTSVDVETAKQFANGQTYTKHPMFALAYFYCVGTHPHSQIMNDENLGDNELFGKLDDLISSPIDSEVAGVLGMLKQMVEHQLGWLLVHLAMKSFGCTTAINTFCR